MNISPEFFIKHNLPEIEVNMKTNISGESIQNVSDFLLDLIEKVRPVRDLENKTKDLLNTSLIKCKFRLFAEHWLLKAFSNDDTYVFAYNYLVQRANRESGDVIYQIKPVGNISLTVLQQEQSLTYNQRIMDANSGKIFISHSSNDKLIVNDFIEKILILGLGLNKKKDIFCTSEHLSTIKSGEDFKNIIKEELLKAKAVIQIISPNYKKSEVCLNEMGAAWVCCETVIPLILPPLNYDVGFIHSSTQQLKLDNKDDLLKFYEDHKERLFDNSNFSALEYTKQVENFINEISKYNANNDDPSDTVFFYDETVTTKGIIRQGIFQGPPWGEEDPEKCSYHRYYYLELESPIDILTTNHLLEEGDFNRNQFNVISVQVSPSSKLSIKLKDYLDKRVILKGEFWGGHTAWHRTSVLLTFEEIKILNTK